MTGEPGGYPAAYCAPGRRMAAALTLMFKGEQVARITEHPWLEGKTDVIVVSVPPEMLSGPESLRVGPRLPIPPEPAPEGTVTEPRDWPYRIGGVPGQSA